MAAVRRGGTVVLFGGLPRGDVPLDPYRIHYHELTPRGSYHHIPAAIREALAQATGLTDPAGQLLKAVIRP